MPSDTSINLKTSAAAALCARLMIHPLDNIKASTQFAPGVQDGGRSQIEYVAKTLSSHFKALPSSLEQAKWNVCSALDSGKGQLHLQELGKKANSAMARRLYQGVAFSVFFQVPGLALFLTTYDTCKNGLYKIVDVLAPGMESSLFHPTSAETHLLSGLVAKSSGNLVWSPMIRIQSMQQTLIHGQASQASIPLRDALRTAHYILETEGMAGLWSGYFKNVGSLLPYTMIYFASYEQLKLWARWFHSLDIQVSLEQLMYHFGGDADQLVASVMASIASYFRGPGHTKQNKDVEFWRRWWADTKKPRSNVPAQMPLSTYMACVSGSVMLSATICHLSTGMMNILQERRLPSSASKPAPATAVTSARPFKALPSNNTYVYPSKTALQLQTGSSILFPTKRRPSLTGTTSNSPGPLVVSSLTSAASSASSCATAIRTSTACLRSGVTPTPATKWSGTAVSSALRLQQVLPLPLKQLLSFSNKMNAQNVRSTTFGVLSGMPWQHNYQHATLTTASAQSFSNRIHPFTKRPQLGAMRPTVAPSIPYPPPTPAMANSFAASLSPSSSSTLNTTASSATNMGVTFRSLSQMAATMRPNYDTISNVMKTPPPSSSFTNQPRTMPITLMNTTSPLGPAPTGYAPSPATPASAVTAFTSTSNTSGIWRVLIRGLGSRILWTVPGVTLTTAGFEVLRNMAQHNGSS